MGNKSIMRLINVGAKGKADNNAKAKKTCGICSS